MKNLLNILGKLAVIFIFSLAVYLLYHKLKAYSFNEIKIAVNAISPKALIFSFCLMVMNFIVLMGYDWLALKAIKKKIETGPCRFGFFCRCSYQFELRSASWRKHGTVPFV